ncbi:MAG: hypothetical protein MSS94_02570, partial [Clostridiales bacterium]|nr:hypothetical protein [Clostridiales bacterium]
VALLIGFHNVRKFDHLHLSPIMEWAMRKPKAPQCNRIVTHSGIKVNAFWLENWRFKRLNNIFTGFFSGIFLFWRLW